jgi:hypothetical protein
MPGPLIGLLWAMSFAIGIFWQWRWPAHAAPWNKRIFAFYFHFFAPVVVLFAYTVVPANASTLLALGAVIIASWIVLSLGLLYARAAARSRGEQGVLALGAAGLFLDLRLRRFRFDPLDDQVVVDRFDPDEALLFVSSSIGIVCQWGLGGMERCG